MSFRETIDKHIDAGTCYICGKPVVDGEAVHGLSGAHWACHEDEELKTKAAMDSVDGNLSKAFGLLKRLER